MAFRSSATRPGIAGFMFGLAAASACGGSSTPPSPGTPGTGGSQTITGRERVGWAQPAANAAEIAGFAYAIYVDGTRAVLTGDTCTPSTAAEFECSAPLPPLTPGAHTIQLATFIISSGTLLESDRSAPLRVTVAASTASGNSAPPQHSTIVTSDGHRFHAEVVARGLEDPTDIAIAVDGRVFVAERAGRVHITAPAGRDGLAETPAIELDDVATSDEAGLTAVALHPDFDRNRQVFLAYAIDGRDGSAFRIMRFGERNGTLAQGAVIVQQQEPSPNAVMRFGPDARLYVGLSAGNDARTAQSAGSFLGKILRLNDDGTTPHDNPRASAAFSSGHREPRGLAWHPATRALWEVDRDIHAGDEVNFIVGGADYGWPLAKGVESSARSVPALLVLTAGTDVSGASFVPIGRHSPLGGELLVASRGAEDLLRIRLGSNRDRPGLVEGMLQGRYGRIGAVAVSADATIYIATANRDTWGAGHDVLIRLSAEQ